MVTNSIKTLKTVHIKNRTLYFLVYNALLDMERCLQCIVEENNWVQEGMCNCSPILIKIEKHLFVSEW